MVAVVVVLEGAMGRLVCIGCVWAGREKGKNKKEGRSDQGNRAGLAWLRWEGRLARFGCKSGNKYIVRAAARSGSAN